MQRCLVKETIKKVGKKVKLDGWVNSIRDHGKITFIDLRDRSGIVQGVGENLPKVTSESVIEMVGEVKARPKNLINPKIETGKVEVQIEKIEIITQASELPIPIDSDGYDIDEDI